VLLPSGYQANHAAIGAIAGVAATAGRNVRFLLDKLVHASLLDAVRATEVAFRIFPHNGIEKLGRLLDSADADELQVVVTESIFSMDGDAADLPSIAELKRRYDFILFLDEAHASGVYGPDGRGYAASLNLSEIVDLSIVTLSKALGSIGGAVCGSARWCDAIVNFGRAYLFSTAVPPSVCATACAAIEVCCCEPHRRQRVLALAARVRSELLAGGAEIPSGDSPIVPIILGEESAALSAAGRLRDAGLFVPAIRPPTVARGTSRLRVTLSCEHTDAEVESLLAALRGARIVCR
jgi:7-keto-8-aminopelargonate synthetase-like enzyme